jgi:hypothetical protein
MKKTISIIALGILSSAFIGAVMSSSEWGEREDEERYEKDYESDDNERGAFRRQWLELRADVAPIDNQTYQSECGGCHFAYQPGLLPRQDWERVMNSLAEHYGDDASLDELHATEIRGYLLDNAADRAGSSRARAFAAAADRGELLPRITTGRYFQREHYEIPVRVVRDNAEVVSFANCQACHRTADAGIYNEHQVVIPGFGKWDD